MLVSFCSDSVVTFNCKQSLSHASSIVAESQAAVVLFHQSLSKRMNYSGRHTPSQAWFWAWSDINDGSWYESGRFVLMIEASRTESWLTFATFFLSTNQRPVLDAWIESVCLSLFRRLSEAMKRTTLIWLSVSKRIPSQQFVLLYSKRRISSWKRKNHRQKQIWRAIFFSRPRKAWRNTLPPLSV